MKPWKLLAGVAVLAVANPLTATAAPVSGADRFTQTDAGPVDSALIPSTQSDAPVKVIVEMTEDPVAVVEAKASGSLSEGQKESVRQKVRGQQRAVKAKAQGKGGRVLAEMQDAYNGVKIQIAGNQVEDLAATPGVKAVHGVQIMETTNATSVPYLGVPQVWESTGYTGKGVKVGIIDSGIDYTHATFGGAGTVAAYEAARAAETAPADPAQFGPNAPRIKGGWDFVGDAYDANDPAKATPKPDANPLDCGGHGSHVAGTAGGGGVTPDGAAYTGPYNTATGQKEWKVGPGVAPEADLYAYRVFGCDGSTDVTVEAIDRAVKDGMDVINMSLGSSYGTADDPSAVAASNAVGAGVVVVASAGNSGPNPYLVGSPSTGRGVLSVAANDSTAQFPGATITLPDGSTLPSIVANGVKPVPAGPFTVVILKDDPATGENEALGCSTEAYTKNGVVAGANQMAVSTRGTCARVAKAVWAQKAGAAAAAMINNTADFPPYEGPILENPDTSEKHTVTIPFLGVRGVLGAAETQDGDKLVAANGQQVTLSETLLTNPAFTNFASFSSGGPRTADSGHKPNITAPGVSTASANVGTGNDVSIKSGTSMAAPHAAGVAALNVQAHPEWDARAVSANLVNTADPAKVGNYRLTLGGSGQVDVPQSVANQVTAVGDTFRTASGDFNEASLSFGFAESTGVVRATKKVTLTNHGGSPVTLKVSHEATKQSVPARVSFSRSSVTVPARGTATVDVTVTVDMTKVGSALASEFALYEASGHVVFSGADQIRIPWLVVPRASADVRVEAKGELNPQTKKDGSVAVRNAVKLELLNKEGALGTTADLFQLGLVDPQGDARVPGVPGTDLRAVGVQSVADGDDQLLVFAVNSWDRYSNAARNETQVIIDTNSDGKADKVVYAVDSGLVRSDSVNGRNEVFVYDVATKRTSSAGFLAVSPTDNSTVLLPVRASTLGITQASGTFGYTAAIGSIVDSAAGDSFDGTARYNPWTPAIQNGQRIDLPKGARKVKVDAAISATAFADQQPEGLMVVAIDNASGAPEAMLIQRKSR